MSQEGQQAIPVSTPSFLEIRCACYRQQGEGRQKINKSDSGLYTEQAILPPAWGKCQGTNWIVCPKGRKPLSPAVYLHRHMPWNVYALGECQPTPREFRPILNGVITYYCKRRISRGSKRLRRSGLTFAGPKTNMQAKA